MLRQRRSSPLASDGPTALLPEDHGPPSPAGRPSRSSNSISLRQSRGPRVAVEFDNTDESGRPQSLVENLADLSHDNDDHEDDDSSVSFSEHLEDELGTSSQGTGSQLGTSSGHGSHSHQTGTRRHATAAEQIAKAESRALERTKACTIFLLISVTLLLAQAVYFFVELEEMNDFHNAYEIQGNQILESIGRTLDQTLGAVDNFMDSVESDHLAYAAAQQSNNSNSEAWPLVIIPDFAVRAAKVLSLSRASVLTVSPKVQAGVQRTEWETWARQNDGWIQESLEIQNNNPNYEGRQHSSWLRSDSIHGFHDPLPETAPGPHYPTYYSAPIAPAENVPAYNGDLYLEFAEELNEMEDQRVVTMSRTQTSSSAQQRLFQALVAGGGGTETNNYYAANEPLVNIYYPIAENVTQRVAATTLSASEAPIVGTIAITMFWRDLIRNILRKGADGMVVVLGNDCGQSFTYQLFGPTAEYLGVGDLHDPEYDDEQDFTQGFFYLYELMGVATSTASTNATNSSSTVDKSTGQNAFNRVTSDNKYTGFPLSADYCPYWIKLYASDEMREEHETAKPLIFLTLTVLIFVIAACMFKVYDCVSEQRTKKTLRIAAQSSAVVASLFPKVVRDRLFPFANTAGKKANDNNTNNKRESGVFVENAKMRVQNFLDAGASSHNRRNLDDSEERDSSQQQQQAHQVDENAPIAELFTDTTVMFADIAGFTAWSSVREPAQVFILLESLYGAYDKIARRRGVFKVETIGDCYMAVTGLPEPRKDHALVMCKFARDIRDKTTELTLKLGRTLGPDTDDLELRIGLNSGPVTAGVLRGERSRFQLFGDTVNTASRMESTGVVSKIQASPNTAELLKKAGKSHWLTKRLDAIEAKGKGVIQTYWVEPSSRGGSNASTASSFSDEDDDDFEELDEKTMRLVDWNVEIMAKLIKQIVARREAWDTLKRKGVLRRTSAIPAPGDSLGSGTFRSKPGGTVLDEVQEVVELPEYDPRLAHSPTDPANIQLDETVMIQLKEYVSIIAVMYRSNPFHCFEHASHVTMSVTKLLSRIVAPTDSAIQTAQDGKSELASTLHDHTYGITSDPLTQFACVFSALIHDVDHQGVPNAQLIKEQSPLDAIYKGKSLAEQNSVDLSWKLLMEDQFEELRNIICPTPADKTHFRHLVVNSVMATDIMDKDLKTLRNERWDKAFAADGSRLREPVHVKTNRKATIVIEHLIQASDVSHTMQHWHIYRKWNERLFSEMYLAYKAGRSENNPAEFWYKGEMGFFDFYIIPLAKKLSECGVFGVSSDEYLSYAMKNREEWEHRGQEVVATMMSKFAVEEKKEDEDTTEEEKQPELVDIPIIQTSKGYQRD